MGKHNILWISDSNVGIQQPPDWNIRVVPPEDGLSLLSSDFSAVVLDLPVDGWTAATLIEEVQRIAREVPVLVRDPDISLTDAARLAHLGVQQFLPSGEDPFPLIAQVIEDQRRGGALTHLANRVENADWERLLVGNSAEMRRIAHIVRLVGNRRATVLITGETGTGKELAARSLHLAGSRRNSQMVAVNCSALPESLLESELFGHVRGAFTGALQNRIGRFEQASGGTIFLDEIGELPLELQSKLLRVLQERDIQRLGSSETLKVDVRIVAATNCDLERRVEEGTFREDLYYRLNVVPLCMPPLRDRTSDVPLLAGHFVEKICRAEGLPLKRLLPDTEQRLSTYSWPGNVRQLENAIETAIALSGDRSVLTPIDFPMLAPARQRPIPINGPVVSVPDSGLDYESTLAGIERSILEQALLKTGGNKKAAALMLHLKRTTLSAKVRSLAFG
jgi:DNA-binding NtrC family response regulator